ncbi:uncharacterized protein LOC110684165 [Chenopodium quinoa]|uniref:Uncharacterized protein n=1 Tax=Chenopodium quinoa TaxID=63459 RepID=A0A803LCT7_CHEQI|nr:uncharacterized protein LOC110684165 [Chenopodium quinoa]
MNAASNSRTDFIADYAGDSDSDTNSDEIADYYQPISSIDGNEDGNLNNPNINGYHDPNDAVNQHSSLSNGHDYSAAAENGVRALNLSEDEVERESEAEVEEEDEQRMGVDLDSAMRRAIEEDESRRNAPLSSENAVRVMEAMRGVSFPGMPPDWVSDLPEDRWVHQLQRLCQPPHSTA